MLLSLQAGSQRSQDSTVTVLTRTTATKHKTLFPTEVSLHSTSALNSQVIHIYNYKTLLTHSPRKKQELSHLHKGLNKQKLTSTEVCFHCSNAKVTPSLQILLKAYNKLSKTSNL